MPDPYDQDHGLALLHFEYDAIVANADPAQPAEFALEDAATVGIPLQRVSIL